MAKKVTVNFKFEIGDLAAFNVGKPIKKAFIDIKNRFSKDKKIYTEKHMAEPGPLLVTDRWYEECYGGVQIHYNVRPIKFDGITYGPSSELLRMREIELTPYPLDKE